MICIFCERKLEPAFEGAEETFQVSEGGEVQVRFSYGSRHDQFPGGGIVHNHLDMLLFSEKIVGYVCDDCFERKQHLFEGYTLIPCPSHWSKNT